jgi:tetratricopeptide (TPR) repeat protein
MKALDIKPDLYNTHSSLGTMYIFKRDYSQADATFRRMFSSSDTNVRSLGRNLLSLIPLSQGKFKETMKLLDEGIAADEMEGSAGPANGMKHFLKAFIYGEWGDVKSAQGEFEIWVDIMERIRPLDAVRGRHIYIRFLAESGMIEEAKEAAEHLKRDIEESQPSKIGYYWGARSFIQRAEGERSAAAASMKRALKTSSWGDFPGLFYAGITSLEDGNLGEAVEYLERASSTYNELRGLLGVWSAKVHYMLGQAYEESGWTDKAIAEYEEFLEIWKDADPGIVEVDDAKGRLAKLKAQS